jgi:hypothetical protein
VILFMKNALKIREIRYMSKGGGGVGVLDRGGTGTRGDITEPGKRGAGMRARQ